MAGVTHWMPLPAFPDQMAISCGSCDFWREADSRCMCEDSQWAGDYTPLENYCSKFEPIHDHPERPGACQNYPYRGCREMVHGQWVIERSPVEAEIKCSECGYFYIEADSYARVEYNYCPNCGAKMDGGETNE